MNVVQVCTCYGHFSYYLDFHIVDIAIYFFPICLKVGAASVTCDPEKFNVAFLCKPNEAYCAWILDREKWEGEFQ